MSEAGPVRYDSVELRGRIAICFSVGELKALAESLGVGAVPWERGIHEAAREVVRQCERYAGLPALVAKLREVRPLVEWPDPTGAPAPAALPPTLMGQPAFAPASEGASMGTAPPNPGTMGTAPPNPGTMGTAPPSPAANPGAPPLLDPYAPPPGPPAIPAPRPPPPAGYAGAAPPAGAGWPGIAGEPPAPPRAGVDPRILLAVAGLMVVAGVIAYFAGRASTAAAPPPEASPATSAGPAAPGTGQPTGPAVLAADALSRSFANLARTCELPSSAGTSALVIRRVFERCGPGTPPRRPLAPLPSSPVAPAEPSTPPAAPADPAPARGRRPGRDTAPAEVPAAAKGCTGACEAQHSACRSNCGPEPTESSAYDGFQRCLGRCLSNASRCKLGCR